MNQYQQILDSRNYHCYQSVDKINADTWKTDENGWLQQISLDVLQFHKSALWKIISIFNLKFAQFTLPI